MVSHPSVAEAAIVGASDDTTGQANVAFVTLKMSAQEAAKDQVVVIEELRAHVAKVIGPIAKPRQIILTPALSKTRSGTIMRRLLRDVAENRSLGDVTALTDPTVVNMTAGLMDCHADSEDERLRGTSLWQLRGRCDKRPYRRAWIASLRHAE